VREAAPGLVVGPTRKLDDVLQQAPTMFLRRYPPFLLGVFAAVALALACVGIFGVVSFGVVQRTREFGVRMAVGAVPADIVRLVLRASSGPVLAGRPRGSSGRSRWPRCSGDCSSASAAPTRSSSRAWWRCSAPSRW
jgi:hypothetical protein